MLYFAASQLRQLAVELKRRGLVGYRQYAYARSLARRALLLRRFARDVRLLYSTVVQMSLDVSVKRLTWLGTVALPALIITGFYGMATWKELLPNVVLFKDRPRLSDVYKHIKPYCTPPGRQP